MNAKQIWQAALTELRRQTTQANFDTWLKNTSIAAFDDGSVQIEVPNSFAQEWLRSRFTQSIERALATILGYDVSVDFVVQGDGEAQSESSRDLHAQGHAPDRPSSSPPPAAQPVGPAPSAAAVAAAPIRRSGAPGLNPRYLFDEFVVGNSNRLGHAASLAVAENPAHAYNPLFLYGGVGLGKTHLAQAIGHYVHEHYEGLRILYVSSEKFTNDLINAIREHSTEQFRNHYRTIDVLLIDDIQFIAGKEMTQEEFFHTFNSLHGSNKQIVLTSDRPPRSIMTLEDRLRSRFEGGLIADIQLPDFETRVAILTKKAERHRVDLPGDVAEFVASRIQSNIRELEGALNRIVALATLQKSRISREVAAQALDHVLLNARRDEITPERIMKAVSEFYHVELKAMLGRQRTQEIVLPRQVAMYLMREEADAPLTQIGAHLGGRDHTTVLHACDKIHREIEADAKLRQQVVTIRQMIHNEGAR